MSPIKRLFWLLLCLLPLAQSSAQSNPSSLLWEVSGNGLQQPSYVFGTFHILCRSEFPVTDALKQKIVSAGQFYGELPMSDPNMQMQMVAKMMMPDKTLSSLMGETDYQKANANFQKITGMPLSAFNNFKPFMALSLLLVSTDCQDKLFPDMEFAGLAKEQNIPVLGLETFEDQANLINAQPLDSQVNELKRTLFNFDSVKQAGIELTRIYKTGNIDSMIIYLRENEPDQAFQDAFINKRNQNWIPVMEKAMTLKSSFFAVGAGHLGGEQGVIALLRKKGYTVKPIAF